MRTITSGSLVLHVTVTLNLATAGVAESTGVMLVSMDMSIPMSVSSSTSILRTRAAPETDNARSRSTHAGHETPASRVTVANQVPV